MPVIETDMKTALDGEEPGLAREAPLSSRAYTSEDFFQEEKQSIFRRSWLFACSIRDLPDGGDVLAVEVAGESIILTRDQVGTLRAFHNMCSHRGSKLVRNSLHGRNYVVCPYHAWTYDLEGHLVSSKHFAGKGTDDLPRCSQDRLGLQKVQVGQWLDWVFVNLDPDAEAFHDYIRPLRERWANYQLDELRYAGTLHYEFKANWKLIAENFLESYHVPFIHHSLNKYSPFTERYQIRLTERLLGIGTGCFTPPTDDATQLPKWPLRDSSEHVKAEYFCIFPSFLIGVMPDHLFAWNLQPHGASRTSEFLNFYFCGDQAMTPELLSEREATLKRWKQVNDEDWDIVERVHAGHESPYFRGALLSVQMERNIHEFQNHVRECVGKQ